MTSQGKTNPAVSEERRILDSLPTSALITRIADGKVLFANQAAARLLGYPDAAAVLGMQSPNFYWDATERQALLESFRAKGSLENYEVRFRRADKSMIWVAISLRSFEFENEKDVLLSTIVDITERKQAEANLYESQERFQSLYNNAAVGLYRTTPAGKILAINPTGLQLLGFETFEELAQRNLEEAGFEEQDARKKFREKLEREGVIVQESIWTKKDGTPIHVRESSTVARDESGNIVYYDGSFEDITERKLAEQELHRLQNAIEQTGDGIAITDMEGNMLYANPAWAEMHGYTLEEIKGKHLSIFHTQEQVERDVMPFNEKVMATGKNTGEVGHVRKDGTTFPTFMTTSVRKDEKGNSIGLIGTARDITTQIQAREALLENEQRFRTVADFTYDWEYWLDPTGKFQYVSPACERISGYTAKEFEQDSTLVTKIIHPDDAAMWEEHIRIFHGQHGEKVGEMEMRIIKQDGDVRWIGHVCQAVHDRDGKWQGRRASNRDITENKQAEQALRDSQQLLQTVMDNIPLSVFWMDSQLTYLGCNRAFAASVGLASPDDIIGKDDWDLPSKDRAEIYRADDSLVINSGVPKLNFEEPQTKQDGSTSWLRTSKIPMRNIDGNVFGLLGIFEDITEQKNTEQTILQKNKSLVALLEISQSITKTLDLATLLQSIVDSATHIAEMDSGAIYLLEGEDLYMGATTPPLPPQFPEEFRHAQLADHPHIRQSISASAPIIVPDTKTAELSPAERNVSEARNLRSLLYLPLMLENRAVGTLILGTSGERKKPFSPEEIDVYRTLTGQAALAIENTRLYNESQKYAENLEQAKVLSDAIINALPGTFFMLDTAGNLVRWNAVEERVLGYSADELRVLPALMTIAEGSRETAAQAIEKAFTEGEAVIEIEILTKNGDKLPYLLTGSRLVASDGVYIVGVGIDIGERKLLERQLQESLERRGYQVQVGTEISQEIAAALNINDLFDQVVTLTKERLGYYHTQLLRYDPVQDAVVLISGYGETGRKMLADGHKLPLGSGLIGTAAAHGTTIMRPTLADDPDWQPNPLLPDTKGEIAVPIKFQNKILGVLDVQSSQEGALSEDDSLLLEGLCGQIAVAIEGTRLRQEMAERLEEVNRLYRTMSHEGWETYRSSQSLPKGFVFDQAGIKPVEEANLSEELFAGVQMMVPGGETVGTLAVSDDPQNPVSVEDRTFLMQVSEQVALALESARLAAQTQSALAQSETLFQVSSRLTQAADLQELVKAVAETMNIPEVNRIDLDIFNYDSDGNLESMDVIANWWSGNGTSATPIGSHFSKEQMRVISSFLSPTPVFFNDTLTDERMDPGSVDIIVNTLKIRAGAVIPLYAGTRQIGLLAAESDTPREFKQEEIRLFTALAPQIATVMENRRQFERARQQAERESMLNLIGQKIQSATTVEDVLQIAARELGHALGAPMTIARLNIKDKK